MIRGRTRTKSLAAFLAALGLLVVLGGGSSAGARAGHDRELQIPRGALAVNGTINEVVSGNGRIYVHGYFSRIGPYTGSMIRVTTSGKRQESPVVDGQISDAVSDGSGGWYIGGGFRHVGGVVRHGLAHVRADGTVDPAFDPALDASTLITSLALSDDVLYAGDFNFNEGVHAFSRTDGAAIPFAASEGRIRELAYSPATGERSARLFVAGSGGLDAVDPSSGDAVAGFGSDLEGVRALALDADHLYVGGRGLVALDPGTGDPRPEFQVASEGGTVHSLLLDGGRLFAGGDFDRLAGTAGPLASLDPVSGAGDPGFDADLDPERGLAGDAGVFDLVRLGNRLWAGGSFDPGEGDGTNLASLDPLTGAPAGHVEIPIDGQVNALAGGSGRLLAGGAFSIVDYSEERRLAAVDPRSLEVIDAFDAQGAPGGGGITLSGGRLLISPTHFSHSDYLLPPFGRPGVVAAFDAISGRRLGHYGLRGVKGLSGITANRNEVFVVRRLRDDILFSHNRIVVRDAKTGAKRHSFRMPLHGYVTNAEYENGSLYLAGSFRRFRRDGSPANLAVIKVDPRTGKLDRGFDPHVNGPVYDLAIERGSSLYLAGLFDRFGPVGPGPSLEIRRRGVAAGDPRSGIPEPRFNVGRGFYVSDLTRLDSISSGLLVKSGFGTEALLDPSTGGGTKSPFPGVAPSGVAEAGGRLVYAAPLPTEFDVRPLGGSYIAAVGR